MDPAIRRLVGDALHSIAEGIESGAIDLLSIGRDNEVSYTISRQGTKEAQLTGRYTLKMELEQMLEGGTNANVQVFNDRKDGIQAMPKALGLLQPKPAEP